jgi:apolipoprotein D and lipocalin family protein
MAMRNVLLLAIVAVGFLGCSSPAPLPVVDRIDLERYAGRWYEWARFDHIFERGCDCSVAEYTLEGETVGVTNWCFEDGEWRNTSGTAYPVEGSQNAKLEVQFFWPFRGDYYILWIDSTYEHVLVGSPSRDYLWVLARSPETDAAVLDSMKTVATSLGFDVSRLLPIRCTSQPPTK